MSLGQCPWRIQPKDNLKFGKPLHDELTVGQCNDTNKESGYHAYSIVLLKEFM